MPTSMLPAPPPPRPSVRRELLERLSRPLLARLLAPHDALLAAHGFPLVSLSSAADDRAPIHALYDLLDGAPDALLPPLTVLSNVGRVATTAGRESLIKLDAARVLPPRLGAEDLAATAALDHPQLFASVRVGSVVDAIRGFVMYEAAPDREPCFDAPQIERTRQLLSQWFASHHRTAVCEIHVKHRGAEIHFEISHGKTPQTQELIDEELARAIVTQVSTQRSYAFYNQETRLLAVHSLEFIKSGLRTCFGSGCGDDADFFSHARALLDTSPLRDLDEGLAPEPDVGVAGVELRELAIKFEDDTSETFRTPKGDLRSTTRRHRMAAGLMEDGARVADMKIFVTFTWSKKTLMVVMRADRNQLDYDRRDARMEKALLAWLERRGVWRGKERVSGAPAAPAAMGDAPDGEEGAAASAIAMA